MTATDVQWDEQGRPEPPLEGDEVGTLLGFLDYQRATLAWKMAGLDPEGLTTKVAASSMTLGGLLKHMTEVEDYWFSRFLHGNDQFLIGQASDWEADRDWDWNSAADDSPDELRTMWQDAVDRSRDLVARTLDEGGLKHMPKSTWSDGRTPSLRWIVCHMIEEYARHNGHADLMREFVDGETGE
jgi:uncharacterized damage-inducible protein DinB